MGRERADRRRAAVRRERTARNVGALLRVHAERGARRVGIFRTRAHRTALDLQESVGIDAEGRLPVAAARDRADRTAADDDVRLGSLRVQRRAVILRTFGDVHAERAAHYFDFSALRVPDILNEHADIRDFDCGIPAADIYVPARLGVGRAAAHISAADADRRRTRGAGYGHFGIAADRNAAPARIQTVHVEIFRTDFAAGDFDIAVRRIHARHLTQRLQGSARNGDAVVDGQAALPRSALSVQRERAAFQLEIAAAGIGGVVRRHIIVRNHFHGIGVEIFYRLAAEPDRKRAVARNGNVAVVEQERPCASARAEIEFTFALEYEFYVSARSHGGVASVFRPVIDVRARFDFRIVEYDLRRPAFLRGGDIGERSAPRPVRRFLLRRRRYEIRARLRDFRRGFGAGGLRSEPRRRERCARGKERRQHIQYNTSFSAVHLSALPFVTFFRNVRIFQVIIVP